MTEESKAIPWRGGESVGWDEKRACPFVIEIERDGERHDLDCQGHSVTAGPGGPTICVYLMRPITRGAGFARIGTTCVRCQSSWPPIVVGGSRYSAQGARPSAPAMEQSKFILPSAGTIGTRMCIGVTRSRRCGFAPSVGPRSCGTGDERATPAKGLTKMRMTEIDFRAWWYTLTYKMSWEAAYPQL